MNIKQLIAAGATKITDFSSLNKAVYVGDTSTEDNEYFDLAEFFQSSKRISKNNEFDENITINADEFYCNLHTQTGVISISINENTAGNFILYYALIQTNGDDINLQEDFAIINNDYIDSNNTPGYYEVYIFKNSEFYTIGIYRVLVLVKLDTPVLDTPTVGETTADLTWSAITNNNGYNVYYKLSAALTWTLFELTGPNDTATQITGLIPGNDYDFSVITNGDGTFYSNSDRSNIEQGSTDAVAFNIVWTSVTNGNLVGNVLTATTADCRAIGDIPLSKTNNNNAEFEFFNLADSAGVVLVLADEGTPQSWSPQTWVNHGIFINSADGKVYTIYNGVGTNSGITAGANNLFRLRLEDDGGGGFNVVTEYSVNAGSSYTPITTHPLGIVGNVYIHCNIVINANKIEGANQLNY